MVLTWVAILSAIAAVVSAAVAVIQVREAKQMSIDLMTVLREI